MALLSLDVVALCSPLSNSLCVLSFSSHLLLCWYLLVSLGPHPFPILSIVIPCSAALFRSTLNHPKVSIPCSSLSLSIALLLLLLSLSLSLSLSRTYCCGGQWVTVKMGTVKKKVNTVDSDAEHGIELLD
ncbi:hypothetical protein Scep_019459 [Stephania cephalantha]|uniref:Transmembrane protein n=1 Tax=Stephania cephalantha TaxID=152367 RepID=A0AAP0NNB7_9MAGN